MIDWKLKEHAKQNGYFRSKKKQEHLAKKMRSHHQDGHESASVQGGEPHSGSSSSGSSGLKRNAPEAAPNTLEDITQNQKVRIIEEARDEDEQMTEQMTEELNWVESMMREDFQWPTVDLVSDLCEPEPKWNNQQKAAHEYWDEVTGLPLDPQLVVSGEKDELDRFRQMGVYSYVPREQAEQDMEGTFVRTKSVRIDKGTPASPKVRRRLVAQELAFGERMDELFSGTPPLSAVKMALAHTSIKGKRKKLLVMDVKCAFLYAPAKRKIYIELPSRDPRSSGGVVGVLNRALYGTRDTPQLWGEEVKRKMIAMVFTPSTLQPSVYHHKEKDIIVVVHVDDFLASGEQDQLDRLKKDMMETFDLSGTTIGPESNDEHEVKYVNRNLR